MWIFKSPIILRSSQQGFSLIQLSVILAVASLVLVQILPTRVQKGEALSESQIRLSKVMQSIRKYQLAHGRLPCPADASLAIGNANYGKAAANNGVTNNCGGSGVPAANFIDIANHVAIGMLPVRTLGLPNDSAMDAWGRYITYGVDTNATVCGWPTSVLNGTISVLDNSVAHSTIMTLVSHGADGHGAFLPLTGATGTGTRMNTGSADTDQLLNAHVNVYMTPSIVFTNFVAKAPTATFDDLVVYNSSDWAMNTMPQAAPQVRSIAKPADSIYVSGNTLTFSLTYPFTVQVSGTPRLALTAIGGAPNIMGGGTAYATYVSGSGTDTINFSYVLQNTDLAVSGLKIDPRVDLKAAQSQVGIFARHCSLQHLILPMSLLRQRLI